MKRLRYDAEDGTHAPADCPDAAARRIFHAHDRALAAGRISADEHAFLRAKFAAWFEGRPRPERRAAA